MIIDHGLINRLVEEGRRVKKNPWCCSQDYEFWAYQILNQWPNSDKYPQETMKEICDRREKEKNGKTSFIKI